MKMTLTEKDKKLLVMLSIFVIVVCIGYWGIYPNLKSKKKLNDEIDVQKETQMANENMLNWLPMLEKDNSDLEEQIIEARKKYFPLMTNSEIDKYFTALALDYSLYAYDLTIDAVSDVANLEPYQYSARKQELEAEETQGTEIASDQQTETTDVQSAPVIEADAEENVGIYSSNVTLKLGGDEKDLLKLIDDLSSDSKLRVVSFYWSEDSNIVLDEENDSYEMVTSKILTLSLEIYMYEE